MRGRFTARVAFWLATFSLAITTSAPAASVDTRQFAVLVDGKPAGECRVTYTSGDDGSLRVAGSAAVRVRHLLGTYHYNFDGTELWKGDRLQRLSCASNDDGTKCALQAVAASSGLRLVVNGKESQTRGDVWTTTWWHLPADAGRESARAVLDVDT